MQPSLPALLTAHKEALAALCQQYYVERLYLFGSATTDRFTCDSDLDMVVRFKSLDWLPEDQRQLYWDFLDELEQLFSRKVDLLGL